MPRDAALERRIREDPDDPRALAVYGDFLAERGDPRGDVLLAWLAAPALHDRIDAWVQRHQRVLAPSIAATGWARCTWRGPLVDGWTAYRRMDVDAVLGSPESVALRRVSLPTLGDAEDVLQALGRRLLPSALREVDLSWATPLPSLGAVSRLGGVRSVRLHGGFREAGALVLPETEALALTVYGDWASLEGLDAPRLRRLRLLDSGNPVLASLCPPGLEVLEIENPGEDLIDALAEAPVAAGLRELRLVGTVPSNVGHRVAALRPGFPRVERLVVGGGLTAEVEGALRSAWGEGFASG
ncbi:MAG: hypothetical protein H6737_22170 [Alphaproteobacteria bacterium]|nr:hypothetical protein [Alphaproteobacteria bacterium]